MRIYDDDANDYDDNTVIEKVTKHVTCLFYLIRRLKNISKLQSKHHKL